MTLDQARRLQKQWETLNGPKPCKHIQINDFLTVTKRSILEYLVCMECGTVYVNPKKQRSAAQAKTMEQLIAEHAKPS